MADRHHTIRRRLVAAMQLPVLLAVVAALLSSGLFVVAIQVPSAVPTLDLLLGPSPDLEAAVRNGLSEPSRVLASDGSVIGRFRPEERFVPVTAETLPEPVVDAIVAAEDGSFFDHSGIDAAAVARAAVRNLRSGEIDQGGSTITQQLVKKLFTDGSRTARRKLEEARIALQLERDYDKREILAAYLNTVFFGEGAVGIRAASRTYFRKPASQLSLSEAALLAGIVPAPSTYNPRVDPEAAEWRRQLVLGRLVDSGRATAAEVAEARAAPPTVHPPRKSIEKYPYFMDYVRRWLIEVGVPVEDLYQGGLTIETTLDPRLQDGAVAAVAAHLPNPGHPSASVVVVDPHSGAVRALVGGRNWQEERVNLALGRRGGGSGHQPGSSFKPFVLALAYERGWSTLDRVPAPAELPVGTEGHVVHNYSRRGYGEVTLAEATRRSINTSFVALGLELGLGDLAEFARSVGLHGMPSRDDAGESLPIGAYEVSPLAMATAYGVFANDGVKVTARPVERILGPDDQVLEAWTNPAGQRVVSVDTARLVTHTLRGVVENGTGTAADFGRPAAGKTGTTNDYRDAWFVGYSPHLVASVWVGYAHSNEPMHDVAGVANVTGGSLPARIWRDVMVVAHEDLAVVGFPAAPERPRREPPTPTTAPPPPPEEPGPPTTATTTTLPPTTTMPPRSPSPPWPAPWSAHALRTASRPAPHFVGSPACSSRWPPTPESARC